MNEATAAPAATPCPKCGQGLELPAERLEFELVCPHCSGALHFTRFRPPDPGGASLGSLPADPGEATCFFHADRAAERVCERCGRFICPVCDLPLSGEHVCPSCLESALNPGSSELIRGRVRYDWLTFLTGFLPLVGLLFLWWLLPISGAMAIFLCIRTFRKPGSLVVGRRPILALVGGLLGACQILLLVVGLYFAWRVVT